MFSLHLNKSQKFKKKTNKKLSKKIKNKSHRIIFSKSPKLIKSPKKKENNKNIKNWSKLDFLFQGQN